jgi:hypothetical protein
MTKFIFKKRPRETGLRAVGCPHASVTIKLDGKECGIIEAPTWSSKTREWKVGLMVMKTTPEELAANPNCLWRWVYFKQTHASEEAARLWVETNNDALQTQYVIRKDEE